MINENPTLNHAYMSNIDSPYGYKKTFDNTKGIEYVLKFDNIPGNISNPRDLIDDPNLYILDLAPTILRDWIKRPELLLPAVASPTFGVSIFDVKPEVECTNQKWYSFIKRIHSKIQNCIEYGDSLNDNMNDLLEKAYTHYNMCLDHNYTSELYMPCDFFLGIAIMDVYHICNKAIHHNVENLNFAPMYILESDAPIRYLQDYSALFSMNPPSNNSNVMSSAMFDQMTLDLLNYSKINEVLKNRGMDEVIKSRNDALNEYNKETFEIMKNYVFLCLKCIQSSPIIKNKHECMETILKTNHCVDRKHAAMCFFYFKDCIDALINSNLICKERPFTFRHDLGYNGIFYSPIPPLVVTPWNHH